MGHARVAEPSPHEPADAPGKMESTPDDPQGERATVTATREALIHVIDQNQVGIPDASVFAIDYSRRAPSMKDLGRTDHDGRLQPDQVFSPPIWIAAKREGYVTGEVFIEEPVPSQIDLVLSQGRSLTGTVVIGSSGTPVGAGTRVLAWPSDYRIPPRDLAERAFARDPRCNCAVTDGNGRFTFAELPPEVPVSLVAGGPGYAMAVPVSGAVPGPEPVLLTVLPLYGAHVRLVEPDGQPIAYGTGLLPKASLPVKLSAANAQYVYQPSFSLDLCGLPEPPRYGSAASELYLFTSAEGAGRVGPLTYRVAFLGYEPVQRQFWATPLSEGLNEVAITLTPTQVPRATLLVHFENVPAEAKRIQFCQGGVGKLKVRSVESRELVEFAVMDYSEDSLTIPGIPQGIYTFSFVTYSAFFSFTGAEGTGGDVLVGPGVTEWSVDLGGTGLLEIELYRQDGTRYTGVSVMTITQGSAVSPMPMMRQNKVFFERAPYLIAGLPPGAVSVAVDTPRSAREAEVIGQAYEILPGATVTVPFAVVP